MNLRNVGTINLTNSENITFDLDEFRLDGVSFKGIGHDMLKSQNQLNYTISPGRQSEGSMKNINSYNTFILPKVEIGFKMIDYITFKRLRTFLLAKRTFEVEYYDKDFNKIIKHQMYAEPDELTAFFNKGETIIGSQDFKISFIATLNENDIYTASFSNTFETIPTSTNTWGRNISIPNAPNGANKNGYWKTTFFSHNEPNISTGEQEAKYIEMKFYPGDQFNIIQDTTFTWVNE